MTFTNFCFSDLTDTWHPTMINYKFCIIIQNFLPSFYALNLNIANFYPKLDIVICCREKERRSITCSKFLIYDLANLRDLCLSSSPPILCSAIIITKYLVTEAMIYFYPLL